MSAVKNKTQLQTEVSTDANFTTGQKNILNDMIESYQNIFQRSLN